MPMVFHRRNPPLTLPILAAPFSVKHKAPIPASVSRRSHSATHGGIAEFRAVNSRIEMMDCVNSTRFENLLAPLTFNRKPRHA